MYTETSEAILAPKTIQYTKTSNIFHQNQNQSISLTLSPKSVGSIIDSRCPSHQRIMIPGPSSPFSTLYVDESVCMHTYIHTYLSIYQQFQPTERRSSFLRISACPAQRSSLPAQQIRKISPCALRQKGQAAAPSVQEPKHPIRSSVHTRLRIFACVHCTFVSWSCRGTSYHALNSKSIFK